MKPDAIDLLFDELKGRFRLVVNEMIDERIKPLRQAVLADATPEPERVGEMGEAEQVAEILGFDTSTPEALMSARQRVYIPRAHEGDSLYPHQQAASQVRPR